MYFFFTAENKHAEQNCSACYPLTIKNLFMGIQYYLLKQVCFALLGLG